MKGAKDTPNVSSLTALSVIPDLIGDPVSLLFPQFEG